MTDPAGPPYFVSSAAIEQVFDWAEAIAKLQHVYAQPFSDKALPPRTVARDDGGWIRSLPALPPGARYFGAKLMGGSFVAERNGAEYVIVLFDRETSRIAAFLDGNLITAYRTSATSAAALDKLAPAGPARLGVLGSGLEAQMHALAFASVRPLEEIVIHSPTPARREALAELLTRETGVPARAVDRPEAIADGTSIVLAAARSRGELPILFGDWLSPGMTVVSIGSTVPEQREVDISVVARAGLIVADELGEVIHQSGDMIAAREAGIDFDDKCFSLNQFLRGELGEASIAADVTMFKSVGGGVQDVAVAEMLLEKALAAGIATPLPIAFKTKYRA